MDTLPSVELLERTHIFPGRYIFKVIGLCDDGFVARTVALVRDQLEEERDPPFRVRHTANGRHVAVTLEPNVQSAWDVIAVYQAIRGLAGLEMVF